MAAHRKGWGLGSNPGAPTEKKNLLKVQDMKKQGYY